MLKSRQNKSNSKKTPLSLALKKLATRAHSQKEIETYLAEQGVNQEQVSEVISQLLAWGYLDDKKLAMSYFSYYTTRKPHGFLYISKKLQERGIPEQLIKLIFAEFYDEEKELNLARNLAEKFIANKAPEKSPEQLRNMLARHLYRKGFSQANIMKILSEKFSN